MKNSTSPLEDVYVSVPRGGPIYVSDMVGPLTSVSEFQSSLQDELKDLKKELCTDFTEQPGDDISVDELKILSVEELFRAALQGGNLTRDPSSSSETYSYTNTNESNINDEDYVPIADSSSRSKRTTDTGKMNRRVSKKNKRVTNKDIEHEEDYMAEVEKLAKIKQKQEDDKLAARLHSFSGTCGPISCVSASEKKERMSSFNHTNCLTQVKSSNTREHIPLHDSETLLCVEVYHNRRGTLIKTQEILVLGQQLLTELRDKVYCLTDQIMKLAKKDDPSGYILIEDIFYNDLRDARATEYSKPILDWLRESKDTALEKWECIISGELQQKQKEYIGCGIGPKLPQLKSRPMQATRFCDLNFRLGAGYLYCHQGDCKHIMVIRDMRLIHQEDVQNRSSYPLILFQSKLRFQKCSCCKIFRATKVTMHDKWAPENPCYFCGICYFMLHYSDEKLIYDDFEVFDYIHD
ncbi:snRNA-activating protein complex subunit-like isoform X2 [Rutidosis leptorrhynchoides]|uniref:snRNA-activating protein complex subunit-like isoform X2 n=1 Tax=Rutidosis leptorrhynchoides TaxID=125765 RepID=UPI003A99A281